MLRHDVCDITPENSVVLLMRRRTTDSMPDVLAVSKGCCRRRALARDQQHVSVLVSPPVCIFHHFEVVIEYAVALHVALAKPKGRSTGVGADHVPFAFVCTNHGRERLLSP